MLTYPYVPKTTAKVQPGDFWEIRLADGRYGAGRVLQIVDRVTILGAILHWSNDAPPTMNTIAGASVAFAGKMHLRLTLEDCGNGICGNRPLEADSIEIPMFRSHAEGPGQRLLHGTIDVGPVPDDAKHLPVISTWGFGSAKEKANLLFRPQA